MTTDYQKAPAQAGLKEIALAIMVSIMLFVASAAALFIIDINNPKSLFGDDMSGMLLPAPAPVDGPTVLPTTPPEPEAEEAEQGEFDGNVLNILLLGLDASTERYVTMGSFRTDTIMLLAINFDAGKVDVISVPRDSCTEVPVPESMRAIYGSDMKLTRVNEAFTIGGGFAGEGFENTVRAVSALLGGLRIDYYAAFDMNVVKDVVDAMGGLYYDVDINVSIAGRYVHKGYQLLTGQQVLDYARVRKGYGGDLKRIDRQQRIVLEAVKQLKDNGKIHDIPEYYNAVSEHVHTDLSVKQLAALALFAGGLDMESDVERHTLATVPVTIYGKSMYEIPEEEKVQLLTGIFGASAAVRRAEEEALPVS